MSGTGNKLLDEAIKGTEGEIFGAAFGQDGNVDHSDEADTSLEEMDETPSETDGAEEAETEEGDDAEQDAEAEDDSEGAEDEGEGDKTPKAVDDRDKETGRFKAKDGEQDTERPRKGDTTVPLRAERAKRAELEKELQDERTARKADTDRLSRLEGQLDAILKGQAQARPAPKDDPKAEDQEPDIFAAPDEWKAWNKRQNDATATSLRQDFENRIIEQSFGAAHEKHGKDFETAYGALTKLDATNPTHRAIVAGIRKAPNPGSELMRWHKRQSTLQAMGDDPDAYIQAQVEKMLTDPETRKKLTARLRAEAAGGDEGEGEQRTQQRQVRNVIRTPRSLNSDVGRASRTNDNDAMDGSEQAIFASAWNK
jgi:hypothetical protein